MKKFDVTKPVMHEISRFEQTRIRQWLFRFRFLIVLFVSVLAIIGYLFIRILTEQHTLDIFSLFSEDWEIISEFWQDSVITFFYELPFKIILIGFLSLIILIALFLITFRKRRIIRSRQTELKKYSDSALG